MKLATVKEIRELSKEVTLPDGTQQTVYPGDLTGYIVNNSIHVPLDPNNRLYKQIQKSDIEIEPAYTEEEIFEIVKKQRLNEINTAFESAMKAITAEYPETEKLSWDKQEQEARAYLADNTAQTPLIDSIAEIRGVDKDVLVEKIIEKADAYTVAVGNAIGKRQVLEDLINQATTIEELEEIRWD